LEAPEVIKLQENEMKARSRIFAGLLLIGSAAGAAAADLPSYYPKSFEKIGTINSRSSASSKTIVINDSSFGVARAVQVHTLVTRNASLAVLKSGQLAGFSVVGGGPATKGEVVEIWTLPPGFKNPR
jgi:hypothetical protein